MNRLPKLYLVTGRRAVAFPDVRKRYVVMSRNESRRVKGLPNAKPSDVLGWGA